MLVIGTVVLAGYFVCLVGGVFQALFMSPRVEEYDAEGKIDNEWRYVNKGRWT